MKVRIITASAGTGKTTHLARVLEEFVSTGSAQPEAILATTFTKQAAAELLNRARTCLLQNGYTGEAQGLLTARIGTVNAVCSSLVTEFSFELRLSPELRILDEAGAELALKRSLASVVTDDVSNNLQAFSAKFERNFEWQYEVRRLIEAARVNGLDSDGMAASANDSIASLDLCLGPVMGTATALDAELHSAIEGALDAISACGDTTKGTTEYCAFLIDCCRKLERGPLRWGDWAKLCREEPKKVALPHAATVKIAAARHLGHPRLREDLHELVRKMFEVASHGLREYQRLKREQGLLDFVDQEVLALQLLSSPTICEMLKDELDLVLVDEFQDTSPLQLAIFLKLAELAKESVWVGDPKQAIYGFRGTDPKLMDAAIESLSNPARDPDLVTATMDMVAGRSQVETLSLSYRSRPALVELTNAIFSQAFSGQQGMPESRVKVETNRKEAPELGPAVTYWPLAGLSTEARSHSVASGARDLLATQQANEGDLAILCRTNVQCRDVSKALGQLGIASVVARVGLLESAEAQVLVAALRLWVDPRDYLAAAKLVRILDHPEDMASFAEKALDPDRHAILGSSPAVVAVVTARENTQDLDVLAVVYSVSEALDIRRLCTAWGDSTQRTANLDAIAAHATRYCEQRRAGSAAPSVAGFLAYIEDLAQVSGWGKSRSDTTARVGSAAVTVSTWHAAKGLEWPIVVLFGLEAMKKPEVYGVHVLSDRTTFDVSEPLGGRWIHFWPNPYTTPNQLGPVKEAYAQSEAHQYVSDQMDREALRVLYVGWPRARDRLILAAQQGKLLGGLLGTLARIDPGIISDPGVTTAGLVDTTWAGHQFMLQVTPCQPADPLPAPTSPGKVRTGRPPATHALASMAPSSSPPRPARLGEPVQLGAPVRLQRSVDTDVLGTAVHGFFAADDPQRFKQDRFEMAAGLLDRHWVTGVLEPSDLLEVGDRLWRWVREQFGPDSLILTEWPLGLKLESGTLMQGTSDLVVETTGTVAVIDHKIFGLATALSRVEVLAGQLGCYADAISKARPGKSVSMWVHLPLAGVVVEVQGGETAGNHSEG